MRKRIEIQDRLLSAAGSRRLIAPAVKWKSIKNRQPRWLLIEQNSLLEGIVALNLESVKRCG
jgi:hypothetical protein